MLDRITQGLDFHGKALALRAERQKVIAGNIANADTPNYKAVDFSFADALRAATGGGNQSGVVARTHAGHLGAGGAGAAGNAEMLFRRPAQPAMDSNTVDLDLERAQFAENAVRYEATLRFINSQIRTMSQAIAGNSNGS